MGTPDRPRHKHPSQRGRSIGSGRVLGQERWAQTLVYHHSRLRLHKSAQAWGGIPASSIYPAPQAGFAAPLVPTPLYSQLRYVYTKGR